MSSSDPAAPAAASRGTGDSAPRTPWRRVPGALVVHLRVTPNAATDRIEGIETRDDGSAVLRLRVRAVPDRGRANAAVLTLLARVFGAPKSALQMVAGETARLKTVRVDGEPDALVARLENLFGAATPPPQGS